MNSMTVQSAIRLHLLQEGPCTLESLLTRLSQFSWSEIFSVVDQLSREGSLVLRRPARFGYEVSIGSNNLIPLAAQPSAASGCDSRLNSGDKTSAS
jgi:hypothetical protein